MFHDPFRAFALACAALSTVLLLWYLIARPPLTRAIKLVLLLGIGALPLATAGTGNVAGYHATKTRTFCSSCHVMTPFGNDASDPNSLSLAARHGRNQEFGDDNCYTCHADYGMFGTLTTKLGGMRHVYEYALHFHQLTLDEALPRIHIRTPFSNATCIRCHSTENPGWNNIGDHAGLRDRLRAGTVSCASAGCHGPAHPFAAAAHRRAEGAPPDPPSIGNAAPRALGLGAQDTAGAPAAGAQP